MHCSFELPDWVELFLESWLIPLATTSQRMQLAIALSEENVRNWPLRCRKKMFASRPAGLLLPWWLMKRPMNWYPLELTW
jgi:hypothetical protein